MRIAMFSLHGLFRAKNLEIGKDADNGGQIIYVMELAHALSQLPAVTHVHLFTRRIEDPDQGSEYEKEIEVVNDKLDIRRVWCGGKKYLPKEQIWAHLDEYVSNTIKHIKSHEIFPDWMHSHYADAAYVTAQLSAYLNIPFAHTGHSLGKSKLRKLLGSGVDRVEAFDRYQFERRFEAEEIVLANSEFVVTSTHQEITEYQEYRNAALSEYHVIPPGINFEKYYPYYEDFVGSDQKKDLQIQALANAMEELDTFFSNPSKPVILTICRPDKKKNIHGLIHAYGTDKNLQAIANLAIYAGIRSNIQNMPSGEKEVLTEILLLMDRYNLYGKLAIPKKHDTQFQVAEIYRWCARQKGVFVNIALTEPFGLTVLEASGCGVPVVATKEGGPSEIIPRCQNGILVDPNDTKEIQDALKTILTQEETWRTFSRTGTRKVREHYSWDAHAESYVKLIESNLSNSRGLGVKNSKKVSTRLGRMKKADRMIITDIDGTLVDPSHGHPGLDELRQILSDRGDRFLFGYATGRSLDKVLEVVEECNLPDPDVVIAAVGSCIYYGLEEKLVDKGWQEHIRFRWAPKEVRSVVSKVEGLRLQEEENQNPFKISCYIEKGFKEETLREALGKSIHRVNIMMTQNAYLDILPRRASKGRAVRYVANKWSIPLHKTVVCGDSGNDLDMLSGNTQAIVVSNYSEEIAKLKGEKRVYFSPEPSAAGIRDGLRHYRFLDFEKS